MPHQRSKFDRLHREAAGQWLRLPDAPPPVRDYAAWVVATLDADMTSGAATTATVNDFGGPTEHEKDPSNASGKVTLQDSNFTNNYTTGTKLMALLADESGDPRIYEIVNDDTGGGGGSLPDAGCGLEYADATTLQVDIETLAGAGLGFSTSASECDHLDDETSTYCCLYVDYGCGLTVTAGKLVANLASDGCIECDSETGELSISVGCGLTCGGGSLSVDTAALAGKGLSASASSGDCDATGTGGAYCCLTVNLGCGLEFSGDDIQVKNDDLAGTGLSPEGTCALAVDYDPTYFTIINNPGQPDDGQLTLDCDPITDVTCTLTKVGNNLRLSLTLNYCSGKTAVTRTCDIEGVDTC